ncbi:class F sortase [Streptomyces sp. DASNCL29]|uniref:class F sortase n=1 Tax=Streptomyces sp. DASNCL29 TaxID=2583819 RepID=UPI00110FBA86|nr:class F sortase [Streptomyces sp. DASNCL29]TMU90295.1 class F sortase [Streptomyces sp. DASNCL29]
MGKPAKQGAADGNTRILRWAAASAIIGVFLIYNSVDAASQNTPSAARPAASAPASISAPESDTSNEDTYADSPESTTAPESRPGPALPRSPASHLDIPSIGVSAPFTPLSLDAAGVLVPPPDTDQNLVGWYEGGPAPGERGNAIVAGHVDTKIGPAVFYALGQLKPKSKVAITREDGIVATFVVDKVKTFKKDAFPDKQVYGDTPNAQLRLITCGGAYDHTAKDYTANVVVFAHLSSYRYS